MPPDAPLSRRALVSLIVAFAVIWFAGIDQRTLLHPDEADPDALLAAIAGALARGRRTSALPFPTDGASHVSDEMRELLSARIVRPRRAEVA